MTSQPAQHESGASTTGLVLGVIAAVLMLGSYNGSAISLVAGLLASLVGLTLGIVSRREVTITLSVVALLGHLAIGFGILGV